LAHAEPKQISDLQACDRGDRDERYGSWGLGAHNAKPDGDAEGNQDGRNQDEYSKALSKNRPNQEHENGQQHVGWTFLMLYVRTSPVNFQITRPPVAGGRFQITNVVNNPTTPTVPVDHNKRFAVTVLGSWT
jgi:hypothetical protein